jgi:hypothetical protein
MHVRPPAAALGRCHSRIGCRLGHSVCAQHPPCAGGVAKGCARAAGGRQHFYRVRRWSGLWGRFAPPRSASVPARASHPGWSSPLCYPRASATTPCLPLTLPLWLQCAAPSCQSSLLLSHTPPRPAARSLCLPRPLRLAPQRLHQRSSPTSFCRRAPYPAAVHLWPPLRACGPPLLHAGRGSAFARGLCLCCPPGRPPYRTAASGRSRRRQARAALCCYAPALAAAACACVACMLARRREGYAAAQVCSLAVARGPVLAPQQAQLCLMACDAHAWYACVVLRLTAAALFGAGSVHGSGCGAQHSRVSTMPARCLVQAACMCG